MSPRPYRPGADGQNPGAAVAAPGFKARSQNAPSPPSGRLRRGGAQVALCAGNPLSLIHISEPTRL
ncbi:hypothetical protein FA558_26000, partial [Pseudomonas aeruginosa]|nr:hypothetical protein [Pseudomonas aeruginosa]